MINLIIVCVGFAQSIFAAFALFTKKNRTGTDNILIACLITFCVKFFAYAIHVTHHEIANMEFAVGLTPLTFGPYMYLYTIFLLRGIKRFRLTDIVHFFPFGIMTFVYFLFFKNSISFNDVAFFQFDKFLWLRVLFAIVLFSSVLTYTILVFIELRNYRKKKNINISFQTRSNKLIWLNFVPFLFFVIFLGHLITGGINAVTQKKIISTLTFHHSGLTLIAFCVSYFSLRQHSLIREYVKENEEKSMDIEVVSDKIKDPKKHSHRFTDKKADELIQKLNVEMESGKLYVDSELTLSDLAKRISISKIELTKLLNDHVGLNFYAYVNQYRIKEVIRKFDKCENENFTILAIAQESGFNSKSTFNNLFKRETGFTPTEYRKRVKKNLEQ